MRLRNLFLFLATLFAPIGAYGQASAYGNLGCNGVPQPGLIWTSATAGNTTQVIATNISGAQLMVAVDQTTTLTAGAITFQQDPGDGNFVTLDAWRLIDPTSTLFATIGNPYTLQASTNKQFLVITQGLKSIQIKLSTAILGTGQIQPFTTISCPALQLALQPWVNSYHASASVSSAASATDIAVLPGNATNTVVVNRVVVSCTQTSAGIITLQLIKRSAADTSGTHSNMTVVPDDANYPAGVSVPLTYTANPTTGAAVGNLDTALVGCMATGNATPNDIYIFRPSRPVTLRGTAQQLAVNLNGVTVTGGSFDVTFEYYETLTQ